MSTRSADFTVVYLSPPMWNKLLELVTRATKKHDKGGWQSRLRSWCGQMNEADRSILLAHVQTSPRRSDDMIFIARAIAKRNYGGWQQIAHDIFVNTHPRFTGIKILPRPYRAPHKRGPSHVGNSNSAPSLFGELAELPSPPASRHIPADGKRGAGSARRGHPQARAT